MSSTRKSRMRMPFARDKKGTAAIEFGMVAPFFFMLVLGIFEVGFGYIAQRMLSTGVDAAARQVRTGEFRGTGNAATDEQAFRDVLCAHHTMFIFDCNDLLIDVRQVAQFDEQNYETDEEGKIVTDDFGFAPGGRSTINVVRVFVDWPVIIDWIKLGALNDTKVDAFPNGGTILMGGAAFVNEPYS